MSDKDLQRYRHYESMIKKARKTGIGEKPPSCAKCQYYQPDFKYRKCLYARCPYQRDTEIFRKRPLKKDKDFERSIGSEIEVRTFKTIEHEKEFTGILRSYDKESFSLELDDGREMTFQRSEVALARLALDF